MTVIAYRDGILAVDRCMSRNSLETEHVKYREALHGQIMMGSGGWCAVQHMMHWYESGANVSDFPYDRLEKDNTQRLYVLGADGLRLYDDSPFAVYVDSKYAAWGFGAEVALGAMFVGASAILAVAAANYHVAGCGFGVDAFEIAQLGSGRKEIRKIPT